MFSKATQAGSRALGNVVGVMGRFIKPHETGLNMDGKSSNNENHGASTSSRVEESPTVSFDDFINDTVIDTVTNDSTNSSSSSSGSNSSNRGGGWFTSAAEGLVGTLGKLLQVEKAEDECNKNTGTNQRPKNIFIRDDL